jgi:hypothetical protein
MMLFRMAFLERKAVLIPNEDIKNSDTDASLEPSVLLFFDVFIGDQHNIMTH